jgi:hypothetical protein
MTRMKALSAAIILSAAIATPVFAQEAGQDAGLLGTYHARHERNYRAYNQVNGAVYAAPETRDGWNMANFGLSGRDRSRVGGEDPDLNPPS